METDSTPITASPRHAVLLFATSASVLAYEIILMRLLSIGQWHHFAYMVISIALLGFGAAGSILFLVFDRVRNKPEEYLVLLAGATAVSFTLAFTLSQKVGLDPLQLVWQKMEWVKMLFTYVLMALPFILAGGIVGFILTGARDKAHLMYGTDLLGAGFGALVIIPALYWGPPWTLIPILGGILLIGSVFCCRRMRRPGLGVITILVSGTLLSTFYLIAPPIPDIHHMKGLPVTLSFPDAKIEEERSGPLGMIQVVDSSIIRHVPGLSLNFGIEEEAEGTALPKQKAVFTDGDGLSPIAKFNGDLRDLSYLDYTTLALPYHVRQPKKVLVAGAGGGSDVLLGLKHGQSKIIALEANEQMADLISGPYREFSGDLYSRPEVKLELREARQFIHATKERFDLIQLSLIDSFGASAGGLHSAKESYLYTRQAFESYLNHLTDSGILSITRWLKLPPRDSLRIISTALSALKKTGLAEESKEHILFIRSWKTTTILLSRSPFTNGEINRAVEFCDKRSFDVAYYNGMKADRANRFDIQEAPYYFLGATALMGPDSSSFLTDYAFDVSATTDNRPYFHHFFKWDKAPTLFRQLKMEFLPIIEMGYIFMIATLGQAILAAGILILFPLVLLRWVNKNRKRVRDSPSARNILGIFFYFGCIGFAFMFLEMALLPKFTLLLSHPVYSAAVVLSTVLVFAGLGSLCVRRFESMSRKFLWVSVIAITLWVVFQSTGGDKLIDAAMGWAFEVRLAVAVLILATLSFFLGWPFPTGLRLVSKRFPAMVPWAWGINGCASVVGAVLGKCLAVSFGFRWVMIAASALYLLAVFGFNIIFKKSEIEII